MIKKILVGICFMVVFQVQASSHKSKHSFKLMKTNFKISLAKIAEEPVCSDNLESSERSLKDKLIDVIYQQEYSKASELLENNFLTRDDGKSVQDALELVVGSRTQIRKEELNLACLIIKNTKE